MILQGEKYILLALAVFLIIIIKRDFSHELGAC